MPGLSLSSKTPTKKASGRAATAPSRRLVQQQLRLGPMLTPMPAAVRRAPASSAAAAAAEARAAATVAGGGGDCVDLSSPAEVQTPAAVGSRGVRLGFTAARAGAVAAQREEEVVDLRTPPSGERGNPINPGIPGSGSIVDLTQDDDD